ncbi:FRAS1-related extracellular matrix protein 1b [Stigmatopora argus]
MAAVIALFLLALSPAMEAAAGDSGEADVGAVEVARGRSVFLQREQLSFRAWPDVEAEADTHCKVEVVLNEPMTQRVGRLTPQLFDCNFLPEEVAYQHNGSPLLDTDRVLLRIYWLGPSRTRTERAALYVRVTEPPPGGLAELGPAPLEVPRFYALSNPIDDSVVRLRIPGEAACAVRPLAVPGAPVAGRLVLGNDDDDAQRKGRDVAALCPGNRGCTRGAKEAGFLKTSCQDFLTLGLRYQHLSPPSPDLDYVVISVELRQPDTRDLLEAQTLWLPVRIAGAAPNQPPRAAFSASLLLEVDQFVLTPITTAALDAEDPETPREGLLFRVSAPPPRGFLTHLDGRGGPAGSFLWSDLRDLKVAYQPPNASRPARDNFQMEFRAVDERNASSAPIVVHVSIRPAETDAPRVSWNTGLDLLEGQSRAITWAELQIVDDDDDEDSVSLVAVDGPAHGTLSVRGTKSFTFKVRDLRQGAVLYRHSGSDTTSDRVLFRISDGRHSLRHSFPINILPRDDAPPFLVNNVALEVPEGGALRLEPSTLLASDLDSDDARILFGVDVPPRAGRILKRTSPQDPGVPVSAFLQRDLTRGLIFYQHSGEEIFQDSFDVTLSDGQRPPNLSPPYTVAVSVFPVEDQLPAEAPGSVRHVTLKETQVAYITRAHLHFSHAEHPHSDLTYTVTRPCFSPGNPGLMDAGRLFYVDGAALGRDPLTPALKSFTQHAVDHLKVAYMPPLEDIGPDQLAVHFVFSVSDHRGGAVTDVLFNITVTPVDDQPPEAFSNLLRVEEGGWALVTEEHLQARDRDTRAHHLRVELERPARHGRLELRGRSLRVFTLADLRERAVRYLHDDSETTEDDVGLRVTDGVNSVLVDLLVQVVPVNDEPPRLGPGLRGDLRCPEGGRVQLTADYLAASDGDGDDDQLSYVLARRPLGGQLHRAGIPVDKFSQRDLLRGHVFYVHAGGEIGPAPVVDTVTLIISDGEAGAADVCCHGDAPPVPLHGTLPVYDLNVTLLPVNNKVPAVILGASVLAVDEGSRACLCGGVLGAWDPDSAPEELTFHLDAKPLHGFLENVQPTPGYEKSNAGIPIERFTWTELTSGSINYVQSRHRGAEPTEDRLLISVSDGLHRSASVPLAVIVRPVNDEEPRLRLADFTVKEGGARELTPALLDAWDLDAPPDELTFTLTGAPEHGALMAGDVGAPLPGGSSFTLRQLRDGLRLRYQHDDSESPEDRLALRLSDGVHSLHAAAAIRVLPVDDHPARLLKNVGAEAEPGARRVISAAVLQAEDADTPPAALFYLLDAAPRLGKLHLKDGAGQRELAAGHNFTQDDVDENRLSYAAFAHARDHDGFGFGLSDLRHRSPAHFFNITIHAPHAGDVSLQIGPLRVAQGGRVVLDTDCLRAWDAIGRPDLLVYEVTTAPRHGLLHRLARPGVPLLSFTQMDVAAQRVCYTHDNGRGDAGDSFSLTVSNGERRRRQSGTVQVTVVAVDGVPATLESNEGVGVAQGGTAPITWRHLRLSDVGAPPSELLFRLIRAPRFGRLLLRGDPFNASAFSQADVDGGHLAYRHEAAGPPRDDAFAFLPGDGRNPGYLRFGQLRTVEDVFHIHVEPVDRTPPVLTALGRPSEVVRLSDGRYGVFVTSKHLRAADDRAPPDQLRFSVLSPPTFGHLENVRTGAYVRGRFAQRDVESRSLVFVLPADADVTEDRFVFGLSDPAGNAAPPQTLTVSWSRIELAAQSFRICETAGALEIPLRRSGASAEPAYVAVRVRDGTAKAARDFTHSTASLVQFDPGVERKTWSIYPRADGLEENDEDLSVELSRPHNAVLGHVTSARVLILDPRGGKCDLGAEEAPPHPPTTWPPPAVTPSPPKEDHAVLEVEAELLWENVDPPRGDVPGREAFLDDQAATEAAATTAGVAPRRRETALGGPEAATPGAGKVWTVSAGAACTVPSKSKPEERDSIPERKKKKLNDRETEVDWPGQVSVPTDRHLKRRTVVTQFHGLTSLRLEEDERPAGKAAPRTPRREEAEPRKRTSCPDGWSGRRGRCYLAASSPGSWAGARRACSLLSTEGAVASVRSGRELRWLWRLGGGKPFWMGVATVGQHTPSCFLASHPRRWTSADCRSDARHAFICETPAVPSPY